MLTCKSLLFPYKEKCVLFSAATEKMLDRQYSHYLSLRLRLMHYRVSLRQRHMITA